MWTCKLGPMLLAVVCLTSGCGGAEQATRSDDPMKSEGESKGVVDAIEGVDPDLARSARAHPHEVVAIEAPFLDDTRVVRLDVMTPRRPLFAYYAIRGSQARRLTGDPAAFDAAVADDGGRIEDAAEALSLVTVRVEATRKGGTRRALVDGKEALPWMPTLDAAGQARRSEVEGRLGSATPTVSARPEGGFAVEGWVLDGRALVWTHFTISPSGEVGAEVGETLSELPFTYAR